jgi:hypothetical protein
MKETKKTKKKRKAPSEGLRWYEEYLRGRLGLLTLVLAVGGLVVLYLADVLPERIAGLLLGTTVVLATCVYAGISLARSTRTARGSLAMLAYGAVAVAVALAPVVLTLIPGTPAAHGELRAPGESFMLPRTVHGPVRVLVHGTAGGAGAASIDAVLEVGSEKIETHLGRTLSVGRAGRRGRATVVQEHNSEYLSAKVSGGVQRLTLAEIRGAVAGPLEVEVFREWLPFPVALSIAGALLLLTVIVGARLQASVTAAAALGCALVFGLSIYRIATPDAAVRPELGALFVAVILGGSGGGTLGWLGKKLLGRKPQR